MRKQVNTCVIKIRVFRKFFSKEFCFIRLLQTIYSVDTKERSDFYKLRKKPQQLKTMEMNEAWPDFYEEGYIKQFQPKSTQKIQYQQQKHRI